jgi:hypothetical protein
MSLMTDIAALIRSEFNKIYTGTKGAEFARRLGPDSASAKTLETIESDRDTAISTAISGLVNGAGAALDTLQELSAALGDDPNFATTMATQIAAKANSADIGTAAEFATEFNLGLL